MRIHGDEADRHFVAGMRSVLVNMLANVPSELGYSDTEATRAKWIIEREETVAMLRRICGEHGDNDWTDDLHLADVIEKHLARYIDNDEDSE